MSLERTKLNKVLFVQTQTQKMLLTSILFVYSFLWYAKIYCFMKNSKQQIIIIITKQYKHYWYFVFYFHFGFRHTSTATATEMALLEKCSTLLILFCFLLCSRYIWSFSYLTLSYHHFGTFFSRHFIYLSGMLPCITIPLKFPLRCRCMMMWFIIFAYIYFFFPFIFSFYALSHWRYEFCEKKAGKQRCYAYFLSLHILFFVFLRMTT